LCLKLAVRRSPSLVPRRHGWTSRHATSLPPYLGPCHGSAAISHCGLGWAPRDLHSAAARSAKAAKAAKDTPPKTLPPHCAARIRRAGTVHLDGTSAMYLRCTTILKNNIRNKDRSKGKTTQHQLASPCPPPVSMSPLSRPSAPPASPLSSSSFNPPPPVPGWSRDRCRGVQPRECPYWLAAACLIPD
jgi:hypothetical protein